MCRPCTPTGRWSPSRRRRSSRRWSCRRRSWIRWWSRRGRGAGGGRRRVGLAGEIGGEAALAAIAEVDAGGVGGVAAALVVAGHGAVHARVGVVAGAEASGAAVGVALAHGAQAASAGPAAAPGGRQRGGVNQGHPARGLRGGAGRGQAQPHSGEGNEACSHGGRPCLFRPSPNARPALSMRGHIRPSSGSLGRSVAAGPPARASP